MPSVRVTFLFAATVLVIGGCAPAGPLRKANQATIDSTAAETCQALYQETDRDIYVWVRNAFNTDYFQFLSTQSGNTGLIVGVPGDPRTYGVTIRLSLK